MIQTIEAVINKQGEIKLLEPVFLKTNRRALVTVLNEDPIISNDQPDIPPKPRGMGRYHSGQSSISEEAKIIIKNRIRKGR